MIIKNSLKCDKYYVFLSVLKKTLKKLKKKCTFFFEKNLKK